MLSIRKLIALQIV